MTLRSIGLGIQHSVGLLAVMGILCLVASGQDARVPDQLPAAPPMRAIPDSERSQLNEKRDSKDRVKRTLEFANAHLLRAEASAGEQQYDLSLRELGIYSALLEDGFKFLEKLNNGDRGKSRSLYKHIELALRAHGPRLTVMRRSTPLEYATRMKEVEDFAREGRTDALNAFYGHTVVRDGRQKPVDDNQPKPPIKPER
jgi:hypothetical protein